MIVRRMSRSGRRLRAINQALVVVVVTIVLIGFIEIVLLVDGPVEPRWLTVLFPILGLLYCAAGAVATWRRPSNQMGILLVAAGVSWLVAALGNLPYAALIIVAETLATVPLALVVHLLLAFPSGRLGDWTSRWIVLAGYFTAVVLQAPLYLFAPDVPPWDVMMIADRPGLVTAGRWVQRAVGVGVVIAAAIVLRRRLAAATPMQRRVRAPLYVYGVAVVPLVPLSANVFPYLFDLSIVTVIFMQLIALAVVPLAIGVTMALGGFGPMGEVEELSAWLGDQTAARPLLSDAIAAALGDPSVRLVFSSPSGAYVDANGRTVPAPRSSGDRGAVEIDLAGRPVATIEYDTSLIAAPDPVRSAGRVVALALDRERLTANLRASREALRESRGRIMEAGDRARRRLAQDLHDGVQMRLVVLAIDASLAGAAELHESIESVLAELRALVHGVLPPILLERGLFAAAEQLVDHLPIRTRVGVSGDTGRLGPELEVGAYFVFAEALANAVKHSGATELEVQLERCDGELHLAVRDNGTGGAEISGTGIRGMADRVDVMGGTLTVESPIGRGTSVMAVIPCAS